VIRVFVPLDRIVRVSLRVEAMELPAQDLVTRDKITVKVNAVIFSASSTQTKPSRSRQLFGRDLATGPDNLAQRARRSGAGWTAQPA